MDKGIYTALSGGLAKSHELDLVANNLANSGTPGFKGDVATFDEYLTELRNPDTPQALSQEIKALALGEGYTPGDKSFVELDGIYTDFRQGPLNQTHRPLDLALQGKGFFEILTPQGTRYTRQGDFTRNAEGYLVSVNGDFVLSQGDGAPEQRKIKLDAAPVAISDQGALYQQGLRKADLKVQEFKETQWLEKVGNSNYRNKGGDVNLVTPASRTLVSQGFLEGSNINPVKEMTRLISLSRAYESHVQAIKTYQDIDNRTATEMVKD